MSNRRERPLSTQVSRSRVATGCPNAVVQAAARLLRTMANDRFGLDGSIKIVRF